MPASLTDPAVRDAIAAAQRPPAGARTPFASPADWRDGWIYFLMIDRFNNPAAAPRHSPYDAPYDQFQGGTYKGVQAQLPYIRDLGATAIWLTPALRNLQWDVNSYHGYGIHHFLTAEPRFATNQASADDELRELVDAAHDLGLYVVLDIVLNHTGNVFAYTDATPEVDPPFGPEMPVYWRLPNGSPRPDPTPIENLNPPLAEIELVWPQEMQYNRYFRRQGEPAGGGDDTVGDFFTLRQMRTDVAQLQDALIAAYQYVIARFDVDGFRIDTLRYLRGDLPRQFGNATREFAECLGKHNFFTFGEVNDGTAEDDIARFIGRNTTTTPNDQVVGVDAALDFPLFFKLLPVVQGSNPPIDVVGMYRNRKNVEADIVSSHGEATRFFVTFLDNHDCGNRLRWVDPADVHRYDDQVTLGLACLFALPGIPCVYYGTEQGLHGHGSDKATREALWGLDPQFPTDGFFYQQIARLSKLRAAEPALRYGRYYFRQLSGDGVNFGFSPYPGGVLAWSRILANTERTIVANTSTTTTQQLFVVVDANLSGSGVPPLLYSNNMTPTAPDALTRLDAAIVTQSDGSVSAGAMAVPVTLAPMEVQVLAC